MAVSREIKRRIKSFNSNKQITKAMELVSAAKMRRATEATLSNRPYATHLWRILDHILHASDETVTHPLMETNVSDRTLLIAIASDRGLAGAYNANVIKASLKFIKSEEAAGRTVHSLTVGKRIHAAMQRLNIPVMQNYQISSGMVAFEDMNALYEYAVESYLKGRYGKVQVIYTNFRSMMTQEIVSEQILPFVPMSSESSSEAPSEFLYEPTSEIVLDNLLPYLVEVLLYQSILEATASEHSSRMVAMKSASDNATSLIGKLTLKYNKLRQGAITQEIAEITSGAAALE